tara:strand:- start:4277 stop:7969 length:3693 start_codon:yes stop_codon:yes gene_type:complete
MRLGELVSIEFGETIIGIITYINEDELYFEITKVESIQNMCDTCGILDDDWKGFEYKYDTHTDTVTVLYDDGEVEMSVINDSHSDFLDLSYRTLTTGGLYTVITSNDSEIKGGTEYQIRAINNELGIITCVDAEVEVEDLSKIEIDINISNGISKRNNKGIIDFCKIELDSDSESESDDEDVLDQGEEDTTVFAITGAAIPLEQKEMTDEEKRESICETIRNMFPDINGNDTIILMNKILDVNINRPKNYGDILKNNLNSTASVHPILKNYSPNNQSGKQDSFSSNQGYSQFLENTLSPLIINDGSVGENTEISYGTEAYDINKTKIVLNAPYEYKKEKIENTADKVEIAGYSLNGTDITFNNFPPTVNEFELMYKAAGEKLFPLMGTSKGDFHISYVKDILNIQDFTVKDKNKIFKYIKKTPDGEPIAKDMNLVKITDMKTTFINETSSKLDLSDLELYLWAGKIWPREKAMSKLLGKGVNKEDASYILNEIETKESKTDIVSNINNKKRDYVKSINVSAKIHKSKVVGINLMVDKSSKKDKKVVVSEISEKSPAEVAWLSAESIKDITERNETKLYILTSGEYVRDAKLGEHPYYFYDIHTEGQFLPRHILPLINAELNPNSRLHKECLINQWGKDEENTSNIVSIIDGSIIGNQEDIYSIEDNRITSAGGFVLKMGIDEVQGIMLKDTDNVRDIITKECFFMGFNRLLEEFNIKQYKAAISINLEDYKECSEKFFKSAEWETYNTKFGKITGDYLKKLVEEKPKDKADDDKKWQLLMKSVTKGKGKEIKSLKRYFDGYKKAKKEADKDALRGGRAEINKKLLQLKDSETLKISGKSGLYITSYFYTNLGINSEKIAEVLDKYYKTIFKTKEQPVWASESTTFLEKNIKLAAESIWGYIEVNAEIFKYSYKPTLQKITTLKENKYSTTFINKSFNGIDEIIVKPKSIKGNMLEITGTVSNQLPKLGTHWSKFHKGELSTNRIEWAEITETELDVDELEHHYECLTKLFPVLLIRPITDAYNFKLPIEWKALSKTTVAEPINRWLNESREKEVEIKSQDNYEAFLKIVKDDLSEYSNFISKFIGEKSWRDLWLHLIQHLVHEADLPNDDLSMSDYKIMLKSIVQSVMKNKEIFCGRLGKMTKARVDFGHAEAKEDEVQEFIKIAKTNPEFNAQDKNRNLGLYATGKDQQFSLSTVAALYQGSVQVDESNENFDEEFAHDFDADFDEDNP